MDYIKELKWRGLLHDCTPGCAEGLLKKGQRAYVGVDPTGTSMHLGNLVPVMMLIYLQKFDHQPIALIGGATGMIGDPSGKSEERNLLSNEEIIYNQSCIKSQLEKFMDFEIVTNKALLYNNIDWFKNIQFLDFLREAGKYLTVNYMISKDSVKKRLETGISFTEFSYQLIQAYDFLWLHENTGCVLQMGGSDQWGNITSGIELIRKKLGNEVFGVTCPLLLRSDGTKFGKTESGENVWLDPKLTSPYKFYQFLMNVSDEDAIKNVKTFSYLSENEILELHNAHKKAPHERLLQKLLAEELTIRIHSLKDYKTAKNISEVLFGKGTGEALSQLDEETILEVFKGAPSFSLPYSDISNDLTISELTTVKTNIFKSKSELRRMLQSGAVSVNKIKIQAEDHKFNPPNLLCNKFMIVQKGKKNYWIVRFSD